MSYSVAADVLRFTYEFQLYDIASLQQLYGRNDTYHAGDDTYGYDSFFELNPGGVTNNLTSPGNLTATESRYFSIWDGDGHDTIDASGPIFAVPLVQRAYIDLRPGHFSSIGPATGVSVIGGFVVDRGYANISIAFGTVIEDAVGTDYNDAIVGNIYANKLNGGGGDDVIYGSGSAVANAVLRYAELGITPNVGAIDTDDGDYRKITKDGTIDGNEPDEIDESDEIHGGDGDDFLVSGIGKALIYGELGDDKIVGGGGDDTLEGGDGSDRLWADDGRDIIAGGLGSDQLYGGDGNDLIVDISLSLEENEIFGGSGDDIIVTASAIIDAGPGDDQIWLEPFDFAGHVAGVSYPQVMSIVNPEVGDALFWKGHRVVGGTPAMIDLEIVNNEPYFEWGCFDELGLYYTTNATGDYLIISGPECVITIEGFFPGALGITLDMSFQSLSYGYDDDGFINYITTSLPMTENALNGNIEREYDLPSWLMPIEHHSNFAPTMPLEPVP